MIVFKVVHQRFGKLYSLICEANYELQYEIGRKTVRPRKVAGPLFAFDTLEHASSFVNHEINPAELHNIKIFRSEAKVSKTKVNGLPRQICYFDDFWKRHRQNAIQTIPPGAVVTELPRGTICCGSIKLIEMV